ncbi:MAG: hypothetical protein FWE47_00400 [Oscillospiraceae bacterium]|nr:hypothetical protein [Oscillospiraceae bacterium]
MPDFFKKAKKKASQIYNKAKGYLKIGTVALLLNGDSSLPQAENQISNDKARIEVSHESLQELKTQDKNNTVVFLANTIGGNTDSLKNVFSNKFDRYVGTYKSETQDFRGYGAMAAYHLSSNTLYFFGDSIPSRDTRSHEIFHAMSKSNNWEIDRNNGFAVDKGSLALDEGFTEYLSNLESLPNGNKKTSYSEAVSVVTFLGEFAGLDKMTQAYLNSDINMLYKSYEQNTGSKELSNIITLMDENLDDSMTLQGLIKASPVELQECEGLSNITNKAKELLSKKELEIKGYGKGLVQLDAERDSLIWSARDKFGSAFLDDAEIQKLKKSDRIEYKKFIEKYDKLGKDIDEFLTKEREKYILEDIIQTADDYSKSKTKVADAIDKEIKGMAERAKTPEQKKELTKKLENVKKNLQKYNAEYNKELLNVVDKNLNALQINKTPIRSTLSNIRENKSPTNNPVVKQRISEVSRGFTGP